MSWAYIGKGWPDLRGHTEEWLITGEDTETCGALPAHNGVTERIPYEECEKIEITHRAKVNHNCQSPASDGSMLWGVAYYHEAEEDEHYTAWECGICGKTVPTLLRWGIQLLFFVQGPSARKARPKPKTKLRLIQGGKK